MRLITGIRRGLRLWLSSPAYRCWRRLQIKLRRYPRHTDLEVRALGLDLQVADAASFLWSFHEVFVEEILRFGPAGRSPRILDCGANIGLTVLYFRNLHESARITAFEADPEIAAVLRRNLTRNGASGVDVVEAAVWDCEEDVPFYSDGADAGRVDRPIDGSPPLRVRGVRLRDWLNEPIDFLKLDVEGAETRILPDLAGHLHHVRRIFVEFHSFEGRPQRLGETLSILEDAGFRIHVRSVWPADQPYETVPSQMGMDLQLNVFAWREDSPVG